MRQLPAHRFDFRLVFGIGDEIGAFAAVVGEFAADFGQVFEETGDSGDFLRFDLAARLPRDRRDHPQPARHPAAFPRHRGEPEAFSIFEKENFIAEIL
jgi:hypothetical protein